MAGHAKKRTLTPEREPVGGRPRTASTARVREVWDSRLRVSERELVLQLAGMLSHQANQRQLSESTWCDFDAVQSARLLIALRDVVQLGNEAAYALGYSRRNG